MYLSRHIVKTKSTTLNLDICSSQTGKIDLQPLELREFLRQRIQQVRTQDLDSYSQAL